MEQLSFFDSENENALSPVTAPLADRMRPRDLEDYIGQEHLLGKGRILRQMLERDQICSMIFWGPPGVGKTTLAKIIARRTKSSFVNFSAVTSGIKEIKDIMKQAEDNRAYGVRTLCFVDEIHRFNKAQQDAFLPYVERGSITLIGATTENPSFEINAALLSRCKVFVLKELTTENLTELLRRTLQDERGFGKMEICMEEDLLRTVAAFANGDARTALNTLEMAVLNGKISPEGAITVTPETLEQCLGKKTLLYDKKGEEHYNLISALHKSMRNSDPDAAVYWLARMLEAGEDPLFIARRLIRFASEDIGLADSQALPLAVAAYQACHFNGMPECNLNLAQTVIYLSLAPRSNAVYRAYETAKTDAVSRLAEPVPLNIRNAPTKLMSDLHYGEGYTYDDLSAGRSEGQALLSSHGGRRGTRVEKAAGEKPGIPPGRKCRIILYGLSLSPCPLRSFRVICMIAGCRLVFLHRRIHDPAGPHPLSGVAHLLCLLPVFRQKTGQGVKIDPDLIVALFLGLVKDQLQSPVKMRYFYIIDIFFGAVARMSHIADDVSGSDHASHLKTFRVRIVLPQMRIVIISSAIETADADAPAPVLVPAQSLHHAGLHTDDGRADPPHHVMSQMPPFISIASSRAEIVVMAVLKSPGQRKISL